MMIELFRRHLAMRRKKPTLTELVSVCCCCDKVLDTRMAVQSREATRFSRKGKLFSHGLCPECYEDQLAEFRRFSEPPGPEPIVAGRSL